MDENESVISAEDIGAAGSMDALRGGAGSAFRAPVRAASVGAPVSYAPADPFLEGLNAY